MDIHYGAAGYSHKFTSRPFLELSILSKSP